MSSSFSTTPGSSLEEELGEQSQVKKEQQEFVAGILLGQGADDDQALQPFEFQGAAPNPKESDSDEGEKQTLFEHNSPGHTMQRTLEFPNKDATAGSTTLGAKDAGKMDVGVQTPSRSMGGTTRVERKKDGPLDDSCFENCSIVGVDAPRMRALLQNMDYQLLCSNKRIAYLADKLETVRADRDTLFNDKKHLQEKNMHLTNMLLTGEKKQERMQAQLLELQQRVAQLSGKSRSSTANPLQACDPHAIS